MSDTPSKPKKSKRPKRPAPVLPRGLRDVDGAEARAVAGMLAKVSAVYESYGFARIETPFLEFTEALGKFLPDQDRPNEGVFSLQDDDEQWLSLRYDPHRPPLARYVAANYDALPKPFRSYRSGYVFRNEKPGPGRFRQFMQIDADTVGASSPAADAEMCMMMADVMEALGVPRGSYLVRVNSRALLDAAMNAVDVLPAARPSVLRALDKHDRLGGEGVRLLMGKGRTDESGDFTPGAGLDSSRIQALMTFLTSFIGFEVEPSIPSDVGEYAYPTDADGMEIGVSSAANLKSLIREFSRLGYDIRQLEKSSETLLDIVLLCASAGYKADRIRIDPSVVRGLEYYTGPVFEVELLMDTVNERGEPARFGSVGGGGRYDGLVGPLPERGCAGDRLLDRRLALGRGAEGARQAGRGVRARPGRRDGHG